MSVEKMDGDRKLAEHVLKNQWRRYTRVTSFEQFRNGCREISSDQMGNMTLGFGDMHYIDDVHNEHPLEMAVHDREVLREQELLELYLVMMGNQPGLSYLASAGWSVAFRGMIWDRDAVAVYSFMDSISGGDRLKHMSLLQNIGHRIARPIFAANNIFVAEFVDGEIPDGATLGQEMTRLRESRIRLIGRGLWKREYVIDDEDPGNYRVGSDGVVVSIDPVCLRSDDPWFG